MVSLANHNSSRARWACVAVLAVSLVAIIGCSNPTQSDNRTNEASAEGVWLGNFTQGLLQETCTLTISSLSAWKISEVVNGIDSVFVVIGAVPDTATVFSRLDTITNETVSKNGTLLIGENALLFLRESNFSTLYDYVLSDDRLILQLASGTGFFKCKKTAYQFTRL